MKKIMGKLKQTYDPDVYPNPGQCLVDECGKELSHDRLIAELNHHYEALTAIALKEALPEVVDQTVSKLSGQL